MDQALVGNGSIVLHNVVVHPGAVVGANSVVLNGMEVPPGALTLFLYHVPYPEVVPDDAHGKVDLLLAGHTHGGQIALPTGHALYMPEGDLNRLFPRGLYQLQPDGRRTMLVSSGVGCSTVPVRLFAQPEVHICTLIPTDAPSSSALHSPAAT